MASRFEIAARAALLGVATGCRTSLGVAAPLLGRPTDGFGPRAAGQVGLALGVVGELVGDLLPATPSRLAFPGPQARAVAAAVGGAILARRAGVGVLVPAVAAAAASAAGTWGGAAWRRWADHRGPDWPAALAEDLVALALASAATRGVRTASR